MCRLTIVEPVGVRHRPANHLEVEPGSLSFRAFTRGRFQDKHGLIESLQLSLVRLIQPASRRAARRAARGAAQGARRRRPKEEVESSKHGRRQVLHSRSCQSETLPDPLHGGLWRVSLGGSSSGRLHIEFPRADSASLNVGGEGSVHALIFRQNHSQTQTGPSILQDLHLVPVPRSDSLAVFEPGNLVQQETHLIIHCEDKSVANCLSCSSADNRY